VARSLKVSPGCIQKVKSALKRKGFPSQKALATELGLSKSTVQKFLNGKPVDYLNFVEIGERLGLNWQEIAADLVEENALSPPLNREEEKEVRTDWGEAFDVSIFYGRTAERATLKQWILVEKCRLVALLGIGGIGKSALSIKLAQEIEAEFEYVIWRSLRESPPIDKILADLIKFLSNQQEISLPDSLGEKITRLIHYLNASRCLLVLDNAESILQGGTRAGEYRKGYEGYGDLLRRVGASAHRSCLIVTSREKPSEIAVAEGEGFRVRSLQLAGLQSEASELLKAKGLSGSGTEMTRLAEIYSGNPLALKIIATPIQQLFAGKISTFLAQGTAIFGGMSKLLDEQFERSSELEKTVLHWLAINREPVTLAELLDDILPKPNHSQLLESLEGLRRRSLIESVEQGFTLQNVVMEYLTERFIEQVCEEIGTQKLKLFDRHALMKATAKDYVRATQVRLIVEPIVAGLSNPEDCLKRALEEIKKQAKREIRYAAGNILNLLFYLDVDLSGYDFSSLAIVQVYAQDKKLQNVNFARAHFTKSVFKKAFLFICKISFSPDGKAVAAGDINGDIWIWQVKNDKLLAIPKGNNPISEGHSDSVYSLKFSPDGKILASGSADQMVKIWDWSSGRCLKTLHAHSSWVRLVAFSPDGKTLASFGEDEEDETVKLWDVASGQCLKTLHAHSSWVRLVAFSPDGKTLVSYGEDEEDETVKLWDVDNGQCMQTFQIHSDWVSAVTFSLNGKILASGSDDRTVKIDKQTVKIWDIMSNRCLQTLHDRGNWFGRCTFSPDRTILAISSEEPTKKIFTVKIWDIFSGQCRQTLQGHRDRVHVVAFNPNGQTLVSSSNDQTIKIWNVTSGQCLQTLQGYNNWVWSVVFSPDGKTLASCSEDLTVKIWDITTGECLQILQDSDGLLSPIAFSPDGKTLISGSKDHTVKIWDISSGQCLETFPVDHQWVRAVVFRPDGKILVSSGDEHTMKIWDIASGQCLQTYDRDGQVWSAAFSPNGKLLASISQNPRKKIWTAKIWNVDSSHCLQTLQEYKRWMASVAFSPNSQILASGGANQTVKMWDVASGQCLQTLQGHERWIIRSVAFSPDGKILASGSEDRTVKMWDVGSSQCLKTLQGHERWIRSVAFSPSSQILASGSADGMIKIWDVATGECLRTIRIPRPYEGMKIAGATGLTKAQKASLKALGAVEDE